MLFGKIGWMEVALILAIVLIVFGPGKLPGLSRSLGEAIRNYKDAASGKGQAKEEETKEAEA